SGLKITGTKRPCRLKRVTQLLNEAGTHWDNRILEQFLLPHDVEAIQNIKIHGTDCQDLLAWHYEKSGFFTIRSAYRLAVQLRDQKRGVCNSSLNPMGVRPLWKSIWKLNIPQKIKVFLWRVVNNALATRLNKWKRHLERDNRCELCGLETESEFHALVSCDHARNLRSALRQHWTLPDDKQFAYTGPDWLLMLLTQVSQDVAALISLMLWKTWSLRNDVTHGAKPKPIASSIRFLLNYAESLQLTQYFTGNEDLKGKQTILSKSEQRRQKEENRRIMHASEGWKPPDQGWVKVNVDGAFDPLTGRAGIGIVIRDNLGIPELCAWKAISDGLNAEEIEALACLEGVRLAAEWSHGKTIIESDCSTVINAACKPGADKSQWAFIINNLKHVSRLLPKVVFQAVRREKNVIAHELAQLAKRTMHSAVWRTQVPQCVESLI
ncbi:unnamed protein product, partial [Urochloa humidicola]